MGRERQSLSPEQWSTKDHDQIQRQAVQLRTPSRISAWGEEISLCEGHELGRQDCHLLRHKGICEGHPGS